MADRDALVECVPNFSEGRDTAVIRRITDAIEGVDEVRLLNTDPGQATNRTVVTFVGPPDAVLEAAFRGIATAAEVIDMRHHRGEHPRIGATDVCPLVPIRGITMEETVELARRLGERVGRELGIPVYLYEYAASRPERRNLAAIRQGEYEGLAQKLRDPQWQPDFGPAEFNPRSGATVIGARDFLVAYNVNLNTTSVRRANAVAYDIREKGRPLRQGDPLTGEIVRDEKGEPVWIPGSLKAVKAIGWYIEEYGIAQISINLTNLRVTPLHIAFEEACRRAEARGLRVTGSEIVGMVPLQVILDAGRYFLAKQQRSLGVSEAELVKIAIRSLGLNDVTPFDPKQKIIEYILANPKDTRLADMTLRGFADETASESPAPGGGSVAALVGSLAAALGSMVANLSAHRRGWDDRWQEFSDWAVRGQAIKDSLLRLVDEDTRAFEALMAARRMPRGTEAEVQAADEAFDSAARRAIEVPLEVMRQACRSLDLLAAMAEIGMESSVSDAGVGAACARAAVHSALYNVLINAPELRDVASREAILAEARSMAAETDKQEEAIRRMVLKRLSQ